MIDNSRRRLIFAIPVFAGFVILTGCRGVSSLLTPEEDLSSDKSLVKSTQTVFDFLDSRFDVSFKSDWGNAILLTSLGVWGDGRYRYYTNGRIVPDLEPINLKTFDSGNNRLYIEKQTQSPDGTWGDWKPVWSWPRRRGTHYHFHEQVVPEPL